MRLRSDIITGIGGRTIELVQIVAPILILIYLAQWFWQSLGVYEQ